MERVMARIFQQQRLWAGEQGGNKGIIEGNPKTRQARQTHRPQSARTAPPYSTAAAVAAKEQQQQQAHHPNPKPHTWVPATPAKTSSALMAAAAATATRGSPNSGGKHLHAVVGGEGKTSTAPATGRGGAYARLFGMIHPGAHRRVGVDPLDGFKKDHYRGGAAAAAAAAAVDASAPFSGDIGGVKHGQGAGVEEVSKPRKPDGDVSLDGKRGNSDHTNAVETQATISTANTGSLTPPEGSSSAEGGRTTGEGGIRAPPPVEPLTKASAECCSPQERLYLRRLLLDLQGSARSSLDFYRLGKVVGEGSFAQRVAVKTYEKAKIKDENQWKRISQEVKLMEKLNHPRVIRLFETAESSKRIHLVMEYADGGNLCSYVKRRKRLDEGEARRILRQLLEGVGEKCHCSNHIPHMPSFLQITVDYMHGLDIVHRDIKLENVLLGGSGRSNAKLVDFGFSANVKNRRLLHVFCGTPSYMPPEIIKRQEYEGKPVDVWSLGVVLYAMLCGCFPFSGPRYPELYKNISKGVFRLPDWLSPAAISLVRGMLVTDPSRRLTLRQVCAHPWVLPPRATGRVSTGNQYPGLAASDGGAVADDSQSSRIPHDSLGSSTPLKRDSFHISNDPTRDICAASLKKMEAFGANGEEIARQVSLFKKHDMMLVHFFPSIAETQVLARRHSCLTTTFYLLRNELSTNGGAAEAGAPRPESATSSSSRGAAKPRHANVRPSSASGDNRGGAGVAKRRDSGGGSRNSSASQGTGRT
ncbi:unnamed protein product [Ectocarpus sp. CCAP 1310/34]|nr:unnamed protein product [Ectocarpus sp. CCAP 1310/34]